MNSIILKRKFIRLFTLAMIVFTFAACVTADFDQDISLVNDEINRLHNEDDSIKAQFTRDILSLRADLTTKIDVMDNTVSEKLAQKIAALQATLDANTTALNKLITDKSEELGVQLKDWDDQLNALITTKESEFEQARTAMQKDLEKAVADGDIALQAQIKQGMEQLDYIQDILPELAAATGERIDALIDFEDRFEVLNERIEGMEADRDELLEQIDAFKTNMQEYIDTHIDNYASSDDMLEMINSFSGYASRMDEIESTLQGFIDDIDGYKSFGNDVDAALDDAESFIDQVDVLRDALSEYEYVDIDELTDNYSLGDIFESAQMTADQFADTDIADFIDQLEIVISDFESIISDFEGYISTCEDLISEAESALSNF